MIKGGYYIKARQIVESDIARCSPCVREIWDFLLMKANHANTKVCVRGEMFTTYKEILDSLSWYAGWRKMSYSKHDCENAMKILRTKGMITTQKTTRGIRINVVKYDYYQNPDNYIRQGLPQGTPQHTDTIHKNDNNDNTSKKGFLQSNQINELIEGFKEINPMYKDFFKNKTERNALDDLAKQITFEKLKATIQQLPKIIGQPYAPKPTKPTELKRDLGKLIAFSKQEKSKTIKKTTPNFII